MIKKNVEKISLVCPNCGWTWETKSLAWSVSCPGGCGRKVDTGRKERLEQLE